MSDFMQVLNQVSMVAGQVATVVGQVTGRTPTITPGAPQGTVYPQPGPMAQDRVQLSPTAVPTQNAPVVQPAQTAATAASGGFMQVMSTLFSKIAAFFKNLFGGGTSSSAPVSTPTVATAAPMADAREQLFAMMPTGQGAVLGFVPVGVTKYADRIVVSAGSFGQAAIVKNQGEFYFYQNNDQPVRVRTVTSNRTATGDMHFDITLDNGKQVGADILPDGHTLRYKNYTLTLQ